MKTRPLGDSGIDIPIITLGTMTWGQQNTESEAHEQLDYAVDERGLYFLDTAEFYPVPPEKSKQGRTETYIGNWLKKRGKRDDLVIASKVSPSSLIRTRPQSDPPRLDRKHIRLAIEGTLKRLNTDYIDLYQVHWPERKTNFFGVRGVQELDDSKNPTPIEETLSAMAELQKEGKIRHIGISNETPWGVSEYLRLSRENNLPRIVSIQNQYSLTNRTYEIGLSEITMRENIAMLAYSALNMGVLTGKYLDGAKPAGARFTLFPNRSVSRYNPPEAQEAIRSYVELAKQNNLDPATMAIAFAHSRPFVTSVIIGATDLEQLKVCIDAGEIELSQEVLDGIDKIHKKYPDITH